MTLRRCSKCGQDKPLIAFNKNGVARGLRSQCKDCQHTQQRLRDHKRREADAEQRAINMVAGGQCWTPTDRDEIEYALMNWADKHEIEIDTDAAWQELCFITCRAQGLGKSRSL